LADSKLISLMHPMSSAIDRTRPPDQTAAGTVANVTCGQTSAVWSGGLVRSIADDIGCINEINFESANYYAFAFKVLQPDLTGEAPVCLAEAYNTTSSPLAYLEIITPLGDETDYC